MPIEGVESNLCPGYYQGPDDIRRNVREKSEILFFLVLHGHTMLVSCPFIHKKAAVSSPGECSAPPKDERDKEERPAGSKRATCPYDMTRY